MRNGLIRKIILIVATPVFLFSTYMVLQYQTEMNTSAEYADSVAQMVVHTVGSAAADSATGMPTASQAEAAVVSIPIEVDFEELRSISPNVAGWLYCPDTPINYPVMQGQNNHYYLKHLMNGQSNSAGSLFMDYRNSADLSDWNSIIYGHNMKNGTMFGCLAQYKDQAYFEEHSRMFLLTPEQNYVIELMAGFVTRADAELYSAFRADAAKRERFIQNWLEESSFVSGVSPLPEDRLITLSTCSYDFTNARYVLIGVLKPIDNQ